MAPSRRDVVVRSIFPLLRRRRTSRRALVLILQRTSGLGRLSLSLSRGGLESADSPLAVRARFCCSKRDWFGAAVLLQEERGWLLLVFFLGPPPKGERERETEAAKEKERGRDETIGRDALSLSLLSSPFT